MIDAESIAAAFDSTTAFSLGVEEELMLFDPRDRKLAPAIEPVLAALAGDPRFKRELPASQVESTTRPRRTVGEVVTDLAAARTDLAEWTQGIVDLAAAGVHPTAPAEGELSRDERYDRARERYGPVLHRQLVFALQVHVAPGSPSTALAVYNTIRSYLPEFAALAANSPYRRGADTGVASIRPRISELLPRQGIPPVLDSWACYAEALRWSATAEGRAPGAWWWELRPHTVFGTLELRAPDAQTTLADATPIVALAQCLVASLAERHEAGDPPAIHPSWKISENRWLAARDGLDAIMFDLDTGERAPVRDRIATLAESLAPVAKRLGCERELGALAPLLAANGAERQRRVASERGIDGLVDWLSEEFLAGC